MATAHEWQQQILAWQASGLTQAAYCQQHGLNPHTFKGWRRRVIGAAAHTPGLLPIQVAAVVPELPSVTEMSAMLSDSGAAAVLAEALFDPLVRALKAEPLRGLEELAPGVRSLQLRYDSRVLHQRTLLEHLLRLERRQTADAATLQQARQQEMKP